MPIRFQTSYPWAILVSPRFDQSAAFFPDSPPFLAETHKKRQYRRDLSEFIALENLIAEQYCYIERPYSIGYQSRLLLLLLMLRWKEIWYPVIQV